MNTEEKSLALGLGRDELHERLGWLIGLRWMAAVGLFLTIVFTRYVLNLQIAMLHLLLLTGTLLAANAIYWHAWKRAADASTRSLVRFGVLQTIVDFAVLTLVLHYTGGVENPLVFVFVFQCIIASMLFTPGLSYLLAGLAVLLVLAMLAFEETGIWRHWHLPGYLPEEVHHRGLYAIGVMFSLVIVLFVAVYLTTTIEMASRRRKLEAMRHSQDLEEAKEQIRQADKMAALGELAASMAHDINNPAGIICSRLEIMEAEGTTRDMPERLRKDFGTLQNCAEYLRRVAENWTRFARESSLRLTDVDMNDAVRGTVDMVAESLSTHGIRLEVDLHAWPIWVYGDRVRLQQVILNLINNARDAMQDGGILRIQSRVEERNGSEPHAVVVVSDTGVGIPQSDLARIFEPLFSSKTPDRGTGLGLAISQKIIKEMDGEIQVESRLGEGTAFRILLPVSESPDRNQRYGGQD